MSDQNGYFSLQNKQKQQNKIEEQILLIPAQDIYQSFLSPPRISVCTLTKLIL
jgi:hypothetical protein